MMTSILSIYFDAILPSGFILALACFNLLLAVFCKHKANNWIYYVTQIGLFAAIFMVLRQYTLFSSAIAIAHDRFRIDHFSMLADIAILLLSFFSLVFARKELMQNKVASGEYYALYLFSILGMFVMTSAYHLLTLYIAIELMSFPLYVLCAYYRASSKGTEAALKYFVTGALASGFLLYGISLIYGVTHSLSFVDIGIAVSNFSATTSPLLLVGIAFIIAGFAFKLGLAPFHMWLPDVYEGAPSSVVIFLSGAPKIAVFILLARLLETAFIPVLSHWNAMLSLLAIVSVLVGNIAALTQKNLRRLFAYSSIAQMGFVVMGFVSGDVLGLSSALFYMLSYACVSVGAFAILALLNQQGERIEMVADLAGLHHRHPWLAFIFLLLIFSMAGIPPLVGFMAKLSILLALINAHYIGMTIFLALMSVVGLYYYLYIVKAMYFDESAKEPVCASVTSSSSIILVSLTSAFALFIGIFPAGLLQLCQAVLL